MNLVLVVGPHSVYTAKRWYFISLHDRLINKTLSWTVSGVYGRSPRVRIGGEVFPIFIQVVPHLNTIGIDREARERMRRRRRCRHEFSRLDYVLRSQYTIRGGVGRGRDRVTKEEERHLNTFCRTAVGV